MSFQQLLDIYRAAADDARQQQAQPPQACPNDGTPLESGPSGILHCPFDGYTWP